MIRGPWNQVEISNERRFKSLPRASIMPSFLANLIQSKFKVYHNFDCWSHEQYISKDLFVSEDGKNIFG